MATEQIISKFKQLLKKNPCWFVVGDKNWPVHDPVTKMVRAMNQGGLEKLEPEKRFWYIWNYRMWKVKALYGDDLEEVPLEELYYCINPSRARDLKEETIKN